MSEMVERLARKSYSGMPMLREGKFLEWEGIPEAFREVHRWWARELLEVMREPTEEMLKASPVVGTGLNEKGEWGINTRPSLDVWTAMIEEALK